MVQMPHIVPSSKGLFVRHPGQMLVDRSPVTQFTLISPYWIY